MLFDIADKNPIDAFNHAESFGDMAVITLRDLSVERLKKFFRPCRNYIIADRKAYFLKVNSNFS